MTRFKADPRLLQSAGRSYRLLNISVTSRSIALPLFTKGRSAMHAFLAIVVLALAPSSLLASLFDPLKTIWFE